MKKFQDYFFHEKMERYIEALGGKRYETIQTFDTFAVKVDENKEQVNPSIPTNFDQQMTLNEKWVGLDNYLWLQLNYEIPQAYKSCPLVGIFDFGTTGGGNDTGFESLCFINDEIYQGVDSNHLEVFLPQDKGEQLTLSFRLWSGLDAGRETYMEHSLKHASINVFKPVIDELYYHAKAIFDYVQYVDENSELYHRYTTILMKAFHHFHGKLNQPTIEEECERILTFLKSELEAIDKHSDVVIHCIGHSHIDLAWLWRTKHTKEKGSRTFSSMIQWMERYEDFQYIQSQPQLYQWIKEEFPDLYEEVKEKVKAGKMELGGAMWVESDCNIPSGESLVRQILYGKKFYKEEFDKECDFIWLPDVFGYSYALPQILKRSNIDTLLTSKISWNEFNRMPNDTFYWRGLDGSDVLTYFITTPDPWTPTDKFYSSYNGQIATKTVLETYTKYQSKDVNQDLILTYGLGDGGGGVTRDMIELIPIYNKLAGLPHVKMSHAKTAFEKIHENVKVNEKDMPVWDSELYLEKHRGTYTSQAFLKRDNRVLELLYRKAEMLNAFSKSTSYQPELEKGWKQILLNQFHDILPGSSIQTVYEDVRVENIETYQIANDVLDKQLSWLITDEENMYTIFNSSSFKQNEFVAIELSEAGHFVQEGKVLTSYQDEKNHYVFVEVEPFTFINIEFVNDVENISIRTMSQQKEVETSFYRIVFNSYGQITSLYDKEMKFEMIKPQGLGNVFYIFDDCPANYDAWDVDKVNYADMSIINQLLDFNVVSYDDVMINVELTYAYDKTTIKQVLKLSNLNKRIDFETHVANTLKQKLIKVGFDFNLRTNKATYQIQYGHIERSTHQNTSWDFARYEVPAQYYASMSQYNAGVGLINDCKYGYSGNDSSLYLTLLKTPIFPDPTADDGDHDFTYSLIPHPNDLKVVEHHAEACNVKLDVYKGKIAPQSYLTISGNIKVSAIKQAENGDGMIIRIHEYLGSESEFELKLSGHEKITVVETNLMEQVETTPIEVNQMTGTIKPFEIKTYKVW